MGGQGALGEPPVRCQSALQTNLGLYIEPVLDPGPWLADVFIYQKASASTYTGEGKPLVPQRERQSRTVHDYLGKQFSSLWSPRAAGDGVLLWRLVAEEPGPLGAWSFPPSLQIQQPGAEVAGASLSGEAQEAAPGLPIQS